MIDPLFLSKSHQKGEKIPNFVFKKYPSTLVCPIIMPAGVADFWQYGSRHGKGHACRTPKLKIRHDYLEWQKNAGRHRGRKVVFFSRRIYIFVPRPTRVSGTTVVVGCLPWGNGHKVVNILVVVNNWDDTTRQAEIWVIMFNVDIQTDIYSAAGRHIWACR